MRELASWMMTTLLLAACGGSAPAETTTPADEPAAAETPEGSAGSESGSAGGEGSSLSSDATAGTNPSGGSNEFVLQSTGSGSAKQAHGVSESKIKPTRTEAAMKFIVVDKDKGPIKGIVVAMAAPDGKKYYTRETDAAGYAEVLVPVGQRYELVFLSLGRKDVAANVTVTDEPNQSVKLTLRYKRWMPPPPKVAQPPTAEPRFVLDGVNFDTGKATIRPESLPSLDGVIEYMTYKTSSRIEISGHTDSAGDPKKNKKLSEQRAQACRDYLISKGIDGSRISAIGYGDERPIASNDTPEGRQENRRIEAMEL
jgi:outer membrane protein OmpA-like peptidoglycan-associated protein